MSTINYYFIRVSSDRLLAPLAWALLAFDNYIITVFLFLRISKILLIALFIQKIWKYTLIYLVTCSDRSTQHTDACTHILPCVSVGAGLTYNNGVCMRRHLSCAGPATPGTHRHRNRHTHGWLEGGRAARQWTHCYKRTFPTTPYIDNVIITMIIKITGSCITTLSYS